MREILFRAKRLSDGEWIDGSLFIDEKKDKHEILVGYVNYRIGWEVDPETVGEFTGLLDKNGKKIFEGDIVDILTENEEIGVVAYEDGGFLVNADGFCVDFHSNINGTDLEVIGNIHDNPELLEAHQ